MLRLPAVSGSLTGRWIAAVSVIASILFFVLVGPIPQDPAYHQFADNRTLLGVPNFLNVASNLAFLLAGIYGLAFIRHNPGVVGETWLHWPWAALFIGLILTAAGSGYYHLSPANEPLVWDRLPMTLAIAGFFTIVIGEYLSFVAARLVFVPLLLAGIASVVFWDVTETGGAGDLRPYAVVVILPLLLTPVILVVRGEASDMTGAIWAMIGLYAIAKLCEHFDAATFDSLGFISGHSLKHLFAALSSAALICALRRRRSAFKDFAHV